VATRAAGQSANGPYVRLLCCLLQVLQLGRCFSASGAATPTRRVLETCGAWDSHARVGCTLPGRLEARARQAVRDLHEGTGVRVRARALVYAASMSPHVSGAMPAGRASSSRCPRRGWNASAQAAAGEPGRGAPWPAPCPAARPDAATRRPVHAPAASTTARLAVTLDGRAAPIGGRPGYRMSCVKASRRVRPPGAAYQAPHGCMRTAASIQDPSQQGAWAYSQTRGSLGRPLRAAAIQSAPPVTAQPPRLAGGTAVDRSACIGARARGRHDARHAPVARAEPRGALVQQRVEAPARAATLGAARQQHRRRAPPVLRSARLRMSARRAARVCTPRARRERCTR